MSNVKKLTILGHILLVLIIVGSAALISRHAVKPYLVANRNLTAFQEGIVILTEAQGSLDRLDKQIQKIALEVASKEATLPANLDLDAFLEEIGLLARETGVRIENLSPDTPMEYPLYREMDIRIDASGGYPALHEFLSMLEEGRQLSKVDQLTMVGRKGQEQVEATFRLALFFSTERTDRS